MFTGNPAKQGLSSTDDGNSTTTNVIWKGRPTFWLFLPGYILGLVMLPFSGLGILVLLVTLVWQRTMRYCLTTEEVFVRPPGLFRRTRKLQVANICSVEVRQGVVGRIFRVGTVVLVASGPVGDDLRLRCIQQPPVVAEMVREQVRSARRAEER